MSKTSPPPLLCLTHAWLENVPTPEFLGSNFSATHQLCLLFRNDTSAYYFPLYTWHYRGKKSKNRNLKKVQSHSQELTFQQGQPRTQTTGHRAISRGGTLVSPGTGRRYCLLPAGGVSQRSLHYCALRPGLIKCQPLLTPLTPKASFGPHNF